jgi:hypothetical protein
VVIVSILVFAITGATLLLTNSRSFVRVGFARSPVTADAAVRLVAQLVVQQHRARSTVVVALAGLVELDIVGTTSALRNVVDSWRSSNPFVGSI